MAGSGNIGYATLGIIPSASGFGAALSAQAAPGMVGAGAVLGKALMVGIASTVTVAALAATALVKVGQTFEGVRNTIIVGTGASGAALSDLEASAKSIGQNAPSSFEDVGTAVADLNTRLGLTGAPLEDMSERFLDMSRITGTDLSQNIANITRVFGDWGVTTAEQPDAMDKIFEATKRTGIGLDALTNNVVQFGAPLRQMGFGFEESLALFGKWEKEGVNTAVVLAGMKMGLATMSKAGEAPAEALARVTEEIKNAGSAGEANRIAMEMFGVRAGPDMAAAIREGRFELGDLVAGIEGSAGALDDADARTRTFSDAWTLLKNRALVGLEPLATRVLGAFTTGINWFVEKGSPALASFGAIMSERVGPSFAALSTFVTGTLVPAFRTFAAFITTNVVPVIQQMVAFFMANILPAIQSMAAFVTETLVPAIMSFYQTVAENVIPIAQALWEQFTTNILPALQSVWAIISEKVVPVLIQLGEFLVPIISFIYEWAVKIAGFLIPILVNLIGPILGGLIRVLGTVIGWVFDAIGAVIGFASALIEGGARAIEFGSAVIDKVGEAVEWIRGVPALIVSALGNLGSLLVNAGRSIISGLLSGITDRFNAVKDYISGIGTWIQEHKGPKAYDLALLKPAGGWLIQGLQDGIAGSLPGLERTLAGVSATVAGTRLVATGGIASPDFGGRNVNGGADGGAPAIYVQNPFTGDYLLAQVGAVADGRLAEAGSRARYAGGV